MKQTLILLSFILISWCAAQAQSTTDAGGKNNIKQRIETLRKKTASRRLAAIAKSPFDGEGEEGWNGGEGGGEGGEGMPDVLPPDIRNVSEWLFKTSDADYQMEVKDMYDSEYSANDSYFSDPETSLDNIYGLLSEQVQMLKKMCNADLFYKEILGLYDTDDMPLVGPIFTSDSDLPSSEMGKAIVEAFVNGVGDINQVAADLEAAYNNGTLREDWGGIFKRSWVYMDIQQRYWDAMAVLMPKYEMEYVLKHFKCYTNQNFGTDIGHTAYINDFQKRNLRDGAFKQLFIFNAPDKVGGYYMVPSSKGSNFNPSSWTLYGFNAEPHSFNGETGEPQYGGDLPDYTNPENYDHTDPSDPEYDNAADKANKWVIISREKDVDLASMPTDEEGRVTFVAQHAYSNCTHLLLVIDDVQGWNGNRKEMYLRNFYYNNGIDYHFEAVKTSIGIDDNSGVIKFASNISGEWQIKGDVKLTLRHSDSDTKPYEDIVVEKYVSDGTLSYDMSELYKNTANNDKFPFKVGHWCDAILNYKVSDGSTTKDVELSFPITVTIGKPLTVLTANSNADFMVDGEKEGNVVQYPLKIDNLDPSRGFYFDVVVNDYASGKFAERRYSYLAKPGEIDLYDASDKGLSWVRFEQSSFGEAESDKIRHAQTVCAMITVPVTTIPMCDDCSVEVRAMNDYNIFTSKDIHINPEDYYEQMNIKVYNNTFNKDLLTGTYVVGSKYRSEAKDIKQWVDNDDDFYSEVRKELKNNIENIPAIDNIIDKVRDHNLVSFNFEYPSAWGDVTMYMEDASGPRKVRRAIVVKDQYGERIVAQSTFSRSAEFPHDGKKHSLVLSWQEGKFEYKFDYTSHGDILKGLFCYVPTVNDAEGDDEYKIAITYGKIENGGMVGKKSFERKGHFAPTTKYSDKKVYILDEDLDTDLINEAGAPLYKFNCTLKSNNYVYTFNTRQKHGGTTYTQIVNPVTVTTDRYGCHNYKNADVPFATVESNPIRFYLRSQAQFVRVSVNNEKGEALNNSTVRYVYAKQGIADSCFYAGVSSSETPFSERNDARGEVKNTSGENIYLIPLITSEDETYHLFVEASSTDKTSTEKAYATRMFCELLDGEDFAECVGTGDVFPCVLEPQRDDEKQYYVHDMWETDATSAAFGGDGRRVNPHLTSVMTYTGNATKRIDLLMSRSTNAQAVDAFMLAPLLERANSNYKPYDMYVKELTTATDPKGRPIVWKTSQTGFTRDYEMFSCNPTLLQPGKKDNEQVPGIYKLIVWKGVKDASGNASVKYNTNSEGSKTNAYSCTFAVAAQNFERDNSEEMAKAATQALDIKMPALRFNRDLGLAGNIGNAFTNYQIGGPECFPFKVALTYKNDHYNLNGSFEINALDFLPGYAAYSAQKKTFDNLAAAQEEYNRVKNALHPDNNIEDLSYFPKLPEAFVGFKGYFDAGLYWDKVDSVYRPFFNDLVARFEASASTSVRLPFCGIGSISFGLNAELYSQFMVSNPALTDKYLNGRNYLSHFNIYGMCGASIDVQASAQVGFDCYVAALCAGIRGSASASIDGCVASRPWLPKDADGRTSAGLRLAAKASMSAYAKARFLFIEKKWSYDFFNASITKYVPDNDTNPYKNDPNLAASETNNAKTCMRRAGSQYSVRHAPRRYIKNEVLSGIDAFSVPTYLGQDGQIAYFNLKNPDRVDDDCIEVRSSGGATTMVDEYGGRAATAFSAANASGADANILALQCINYPYGFDANDASETNQKLAAKRTEIIALVNNGSTLGTPVVISESGSTHMAPKAGIDADGNAAVVWPSGDMDFVTNEAGTNSIIEGDFYLSTYKNKQWSAPVSLAKLTAGNQISDYTVAVSGGTPVILATMPGTDASGNATKPVYAISYERTANGGSTVYQSLGFEGTGHQVVSLRDGRFVAATKTDADSLGTDIMFYEGNVKNGALDMKRLGRLCLNNRDVLTYRLVAPKGGTNNLNDLAIVWSQHDITVTDPQENESKGSNSCYASRISTSDGLSLTHPVLICQLDDDDNVANIDAYSSDLNKITSLICVTGAGESTGASVMQCVVDLTNKVQSYSTSLNGHVKKGEDASIDITVRNEGIDPITSLKATLGENNTTQSVNIRPGELGTISVPLSAGIDFSSDISYSVKATFTDSEGNTDTDDFSSSIHLDIADIAVKMHSNTYDSDAQTFNVLASITDRTLCDLQSNYTVKVGVYTDPNGMNVYPGTAVMNISPSDFKVSDSKTRKPVMARFSLKNYDNVDSHAYIIVNTVTNDGNVVRDQASENNMLVVTLSNDDNAAPADGTDECSIVALARLIDALNKGKTTSEMDYDNNGKVDTDDINALVAKIIETSPELLKTVDLSKNKLKTRNVEGAIEVEDLHPNTDVKVYNSNGQLVKWVEATSEKATIPVQSKGGYIIVNDGQAGTIRH